MMSIAASPGRRSLVSKYLTNGRFDREKWATALDLFTEAAKVAVSKAVANGVLLGGVILDEEKKDG